MNSKLLQGLTSIGAMLVIAGGLFQVISNPPLPEKVIQQVPFTTQAPFGAWDGNENCEEASVIMAYHFFRNETELTPETVDAEIKNLIAWEDQNFGHNKDSGASETSKMAQYNYPLQTQIINNFTSRDIKAAIAKHQLVLLPVNAQFLEPANYDDRHPTYHMVVVHSYDRGQFLVHDPGTSRGANNSYSYTQLQAATADWEFGQTNANLKKAIIISPADI